MNVFDVIELLLGGVFLALVVLLAICVIQAVVAEIRQAIDRPMAPWVEPGRKRGRR